MREYMKKQFVLKGKKNEKVVLSGVYLNEYKELCFKYCSLSEDAVFLNREKNSIEIPFKKGLVHILLQGKNEAILIELLEIRQKLLNHIIEFSNKLKNKTETIYVLETGIEKHPYLITTPTIIEYCNLSPKYMQGLIHFLNLELKNMNKKITIKNEGDLHSKLSIKLKNYNMKSCKKGKIDDYSYYEFDFLKLVKLF